VDQKPFASTSPTIQALMAVPAAMRSVMCFMGVGKVWKSGRIVLHAAKVG
jgi:hypothetical protein